MRLGVAIALLAALTAPAAAQATPADYTGLYSFLKDGESIQLNVQAGKLDGFVTSFGFLPSDKETSADRIFQQAELRGNRIHFVTQRVHGCWLEFSGTIERGDVTSRARQGYYQLRGRLTEYITDADDHVTARQREVTFKSFPQPAVAGR